MDVDTRLLRYFAVVAEEGSLTGAAKRLFVSQPALTKQIRRLEDDFGVRLFVRSRSGMTLTEAGRELASRVPALLGGWDEAVRATGRTARVLRLGFLDAGAVRAVPEAVAAFRHGQPEWRVELRQFDWSDPSAGLARGEVDAAVVRLPFPGQESFAVLELFAEERGVLLPARHPLADSEAVEFRELWDEAFVAAGAETGAWREHWLAAEERDGHPVRVGAVTSRPDEWLGAVAGGCVALAPASTARFYAHPDVVFRPVSGVSPSRVGLARSRHRTHETVLNELLQTITRRLETEMRAGPADSRALPGRIGAPSGARRVEQPARDRTAPNAERECFRSQTRRARAAPRSGLAVRLPVWETEVMSCNCMVLACRSGLDAYVVQAAGQLDHDIAPPLARSAERTWGRWITNGGGSVRDPFR